MFKFVDMFVDTHCHYNDEAFASDAPEVIAKALEAGVGKMIQADVDSSERDAMFALGDQYKGILYQMLGLYPGSVTASWRDEIDMLEPWFQREIVAIGEIGLDYHEGLEFKKEQREALMAQFEIAASRDLPVNIHLRDATADFIAAVKDASHLHLRGNLHCFSLSIEAYREVCRYGDFSVGIGGVVTFRNSRLGETLREIPPEKILLETDCPYLAPVPFRGKRNDSSLIPIVAAKVAEIKGMTLSEIETITTENARTLFNI